MCSYFIFVCMRLCKWLNFFLPICQPQADLVYPEDKSDLINLWPIHSDQIRKAKGLRKSTLRFNCDLRDFVHSAKTDQSSRRVLDYGLIKRDFRIYLAKNTKVILSKSSIKRLSFKQMMSSFHHLTFPLYYKKLGL